MSAGTAAALLGALKFNHAERITLALSVLAALVFWVTPVLPAYPGRALIKWLAVASLAAFAFQHDGVPRARVLAVALLCHSVGDFLLEFERTKLFLPAVGAFLCGHLLYLAVFWPAVAARTQFAAQQKFLTLGVLVFGAVMALILTPHLPSAYKPLIVIYVLAISTMAITAILAAFPSSALAAGALLYLISDALIGYSTFVQPVPWSSPLIWPAYYLGQLFIVMEFLRNLAFSV